MCEPCLQCGHDDMIEVAATALLRVRTGALGTVRTFEVRHETSDILSEEPLRLQHVDVLDGTGPFVPGVLCAEALPGHGPRLTREAGPEQVQRAVGIRNGPDDLCPQPRRVDITLKDVPVRIAPSRSGAS